MSFSGDEIQKIVSNYFFCNDVQPTAESFVKKKLVVILQELLLSLQPNEILAKILIKYIRKVWKKVREEDTEETLKAITRETLDTAIKQECTRGEPGQALCELLKRGANLALQKFDMYYKLVVTIPRGVTRVFATAGGAVTAAGAGALTAGAVGAGVGTAIFPGPGTLFGIVFAGAVGGIIGGVTGLVVGNEVGKKFNKKYL